MKEGGKNRAREERGMGALEEKRVAAIKKKALKHLTSKFTFCFNNVQSESQNNLLSA